MMDEGTEFEPITDVKEMTFYLTTAATQISSCVVWTRNRASILYSHLTAFDQRSKIIHVSSKNNDESENFSLALKQQASAETFLCVSHPAANLFFTTSYIGRDTNRFQFDVPTKLFKVQRRTNERFRIPKAQSLKVEFRDPTAPEQFLRQKIFDISVGGLSFIIKEEHIPKYPKGLLFQCSFTLGLQKIEAEAQVLYTKPLSPNKSKSEIKVGVLFKRISESEKNVSTILSFVTEGNQHQYVGIFFDK